MIESRKGFSGEVFRVLVFFLFYNICLKVINKLEKFNFNLFFSLTLLFILSTWKQFFFSVYQSAIFLRRLKWENVWSFDKDFNSFCFFFFFFFLFFFPFIVLLWTKILIQTPKFSSDMSPTHFSKDFPDSNGKSRQFSISQHHGNVSCSFRNNKTK